MDADFARAHEGVEPGAYARLTLSDTGCGMDEETRRRAFEPFFTAKGEGRGTGLGLSTVYGIVRQSGGAVWLQSEPGQGTSFRIYLPRIDTEATPLSPPETEIALGAGESVLVVEDDEALRELAGLMLETLNYRPVLAANGGEALLLIEGEGLRPDLLVTDVVMPGLSGRALAERAARVAPTLKVLYMSGYTRNAVVHRGVLDEGLHFLQKPFSLLELSQRLRDVLGR